MQLSRGVEIGVVEGRSVGVVVKLRRGREPRDTSIPICDRLDSFRWFSKAVPSMWNTTSTITNDIDWENLMMDTITIEISLKMAKMRRLRQHAVAIGSPLIGRGHPAP